MSESLDRTEVGGCQQGVSTVRLLIALSALFAVGLGVGSLIAARDVQSGGPEPGVPPSPTALPFQRASSAVDGLASDRQDNGSRPVSDARRTPIVAAVERVAPSVVAVRTTRIVQRRSVFDEFFGRRGSTGLLPGLGSGFAIDEQGTILTNHHVVRDADSIEVVDSQGRRHRAELVGTDELTDLAVLRVGPDVIPSSPLGTSRDLMVGEPAIAIGNPSGTQLANTEATVTTGVISGVGRDILSQSREVLYADMIQTDAPINPGNSGGPLVNADGEVVGVNSSIFSRSGGSEGLGFSIPIDRALRKAAELMEFGRVRRPWVGFDVVTTQTEEEFGISVVDRVVEDSPGETAGLRDGDVILSIDGKPVHHNLDWDVGLEEAGVGNTVQVEYRRGEGSARTTTIQISTLPSESATPVEVLRGLRLTTVTPQIAQERGFALEFGAWIVEIDPRVARSTRLRQDDVIFGINANEVRTSDDAADLFRYYGSETGGSEVTVNVARGNRRGSVRFFVGR